MKLCVALVGLSLAAGCGAASTPMTPTPPTVATAPAASLSITSPTVQVGRTQQMSVAVTLASGAPDPNPQGTWTSSAPDVATVSATGLVTAVAPGDVTINFDYPGAQRASKALGITGDLDATWTGRYELTGCSATDGFAADGFCANFTTGLSAPFVLTSAAAGDALRNRGYLAGLLHNTVDARPSGQHLADLVVTTDRSDPDLATSVTWRLSQTSATSVNGVIDVTVTSSRMSGSGRFAGRIVSVRRTASSANAVITFFAPLQPRTSADLRQTLGLR